MKIYDHLFYYGYELGLRSKNYRDIPYIISISLTSACFGLNLLTLISFLSKIIGIGFTYDNNFKYVFGIPFTIVSFVYYMHKKKYLKIYSRQRKLRKRPRSSIKTLCILFAYFVTSISFMILVASIPFPRQTS